MTKQHVGFSQKGPKDYADYPAGELRSRKVPLSNIYTLGPVWVGIRCTIALVGVYGTDKLVDIKQPSLVSVIVGKTKNKMSFGNIRNLQLWASDSLLFHGLHSYLGSLRSPS